MERQTVLEAAVSIIIVVGFIGVLAVLTTAYSTDGGVGPTGGYALVASLVGFIIVMSGAGLTLTRMDTEDVTSEDDTDGSDEGSSDPSA